MYICRCVKDNSPQQYHVRFRRANESVPKKFSACGDVSVYDRLLHIEKNELAIVSFWIRDICVAQCKMKNIEVLSDQQCSKWTQETHHFYFCFQQGFSLSFYKFLDDFLR